MYQFKKSDSSISSFRGRMPVCLLAFTGVLLALLILLQPGQARAETYSVTNGVLTISGTGAMRDYDLARSSSDDSTTSPYENMDDVTSIVIEEGITTIGELAFSAMNNVQEVTLPSTLKSLDATHGTFGDRGALTRVNWMGTVDQLIGAIYGETNVVSMFSDATLYLSNGQPLTEIHLTSSSPSVRTNAFKSCSTLTSLIVDADYHGSIGSFAFSGSGLTSITFRGEPTSIDPYAFSGVTANVTYTRSMAWDDLMSSLRGNLTWNSNVTTYSGTLTDTITWALYSDGTLAVRGQGAMPDYDLSADQPWGYDYYSMPVLIRYIYVYDGITHIGDSAFCTSPVLTASLPDTVTSIGKYAFDWCISLTSINMPSHLTSIGQQALAKLQSLTSITFSGDAPEGNYNTVFLESGTPTLVVNYPHGSSSWKSHIDSYSHENILWTPYCPNNHQASVTSETIVANPATAPDCETDGQLAHWQCPHCQALFADAALTTETTADAVVILALGHAWSEVSYVWSEDNTTVTATRVCANDESHVETETVSVTAAVTLPATCEAIGETTYTGAAFANAAFAVQKHCQIFRRWDTIGMCLNMSGRRITLR